MQQHPLDLSVIGQRIGRYQLTRELGRGGMGAVFEAVHESIGQHIAVKVLFPDYSSDARYVQRFFDEARAVNVVQHPGLVKVYDFGSLPSGTAYITMEYLAGETLQDRLRRLPGGKGLEVADALRISRQVASALEAVHEKGIAHRDLKPGNLFIVPDREAPSGERVKVLDFGIAKFFAGPDLSGPEPRLLTTVGKLLGTPFYMSPEQCGGAEELDDRIDVYALGVIMYQMLGGKLPFDGAAACVVMTKHLMEEPPPLSDLRPELPAPVCALVHEMLRKAPRERPGMTQVVQRLEAILESQDGLPSKEWRTLSAAPRQKAPPSRGSLWPALLLAAAFVAGTLGLWGLGTYRHRQAERRMTQAQAQQQPVPSPSPAPMPMHIQAAPVPPQQQASEAVPAPVTKSKPGKMGRRHPGRAAARDPDMATPAQPSNVEPPAPAAPKKLEVPVLR